MPLPSRRERREETEKEDMAFSGPCFRFAPFLSLLSSFLPSTRFVECRDLERVSDCDALALSVFFRALGGDKERADSLLFSLRRRPSSPERLFSLFRRFFFPERASQVGEAECRGALTVRSLNALLSFLSLWKEKRVERDALPLLRTSLLPEKFFGLPLRLCHLDLVSFSPSSVCCSLSPDGSCHRFDNGPPCALFSPSPRRFPFLLSLQEIFPPPSPPLPLPRDVLLTVTYCGGHRTSGRLVSSSLVDAFVRRELRPEALLGWELLPPFPLLDLSIYEGQNLDFLLLLGDVSTVEWRRGILQYCGEPCRVKFEGEDYRNVYPGGVLGAVPVWK